MESKFDNNISEKVKIYIGKGKGYIERKEYKEAEKEFRKILKINPEHEEAHLELGRIYYIQNKFKKAAGELHKAVKLNEDNNTAHFFLAKVYRMQKRFDIALKEYQKVLKMGWDKSDLYRELGAVYREKGEYKLSIKFIKKAMEHESEVGELHYEMGITYRMAEDYDSVIKEFKEAIRRGFDNDDIHRDLGKAYFQKEDYNSAIKELNRALELNPKDGEANAELGKIYERIGDYSLGIKEFKEAIRKGIVDNNLHRELGLNYLQNGENELGIGELKKAIELNSEDGKAHAELGRVYKNKGELKLAIKEFKEAMDSGVDSEDIHQELGTAYYCNGENELAVEEFNKVLEINSSNKDVLEHLGILYQKQKKFDLSINKIIKFTEIDIENDIKETQELIKLFRIKSGKGLPDGEFRIKIIKIPFFIKTSEVGLQYSLLLPLGMAQIVSYLRSNGIDIDQDDLNIKINYDNKFGNKENKIDEDIFFDAKRIMEYSNGKEDTYIDSIMEKVEEKTGLDGYKVILLSIPNEIINFSAIMFALSFSRYIKKKYKSVIMIGGFSFFFYPLVKDDKNIDFIIEAKGEKSLFKLLLAIKNKVDIKEIPELKIYNDGKLVLDKKVVIPKPDFTGLPIEMYKYKNLHKFKYRDGEVSKILNKLNKSRVLISKFKLIYGCPHECVFCSDSGNWLSHILNLDRAVSYLKELKKEYGIKGFFFLSDTINLSRKYVNQLCDKMIDSGLNTLWIDCARADNLDRDTLFKMREAGCIRLVYGMETASPRLLKYINKQIGLKRLEKIIRWTDEAGIWVGLETIYGFPHETREDVQMTIDFLKRNKKYINTVYYNIFRVEINSKLGLNPQEYGIEDIFEVNYYQHQFFELLKYGYNEIGGLKWKDRLDQMIGSYNYALNETKTHEYLFPTYEMEHLLFFLYSKFRKKRDIVRIFNKVNSVVKHG